MKNFNQQTEYFFDNESKKPESDCFTCSQMRALDRAAVEEFSVPSILLMENAGRSLVDVFIKALGPDSLKKKILICCGKGNNGGDGFVMARRLLMLGYQTETVLMASSKEYKGDAAVNRTILEKFLPSRDLLWHFKNEKETLDRLVNSMSKADWIVDALLGTGALSELREPYLTVVRQINRSGKPVFSVDIPTGLNGDSGLVTGDAVRAAVTCTLAGIKKGLLMKSAQEYVGRLETGDIGVSVDFILK